MHFVLNSSSSRLQRLLTLAGAASLALSFTAPTRAQDDADLSLTPADFSPDEPIAIRVNDLQPSNSGSVVTVTVLNRTKHKVEQVVECTLYDAEREDVGVATSSAFAIGAGQQMTAKVAGAEGAKYAECLVRDAK